MGVLFTNNASASLASAITSGSTTITLASGQGALFPTLSGSNFFMATLVDTSNNIEIVRATARTGDTLTVTRAQDGTSARAFAAGDKLELRIVNAGLQEFVQRDGTVAMTGALNMNNQKVTNLSQATATTDGVAGGRAINTTGDIQGGGNLTADRTLSLTNTGVTAGEYGSASAIPVVTVSATGRVTALSTAALDLSTKVNLDGGNATGTWAGTTEWTRVNNRPTALSSFSNSTLFDTTSNCGFGADFGSGNTGNCRPLVNYGVNWSQQSNCGNIGANVTELTDAGTNINHRGLRWNWNCNCNCDCCCCFAPGTLVQMADGTSKPIELVAVGEKVIGFAGEVTVAHKFDTTLKTNKLFVVNGSIEVTGGHLFKTDRGWKALDMSVYPQGVFFRAHQTFAGGELVDIEHQSERAELVSALLVGDIVNGVRIDSIERKPADASFNVHNMIVDGGDGFVLASGLAVDGFMRHACGGQ
jgi:hypothetical protein